MNRSVVVPGVHKRRKYSRLDFMWGFGAFLIRFREQRGLMGVVSWVIISMMRHFEEIKFGINKITVKLAIF